jgi:hypothetical protein
VTRARTKSAQGSREAGELKYRPSFSTEGIKSRGEKKKEKKGPRAGKDGGKGRKKRERTELWAKRRRVNSATEY